MAPLFVQGNQPILRGLFSMECILETILYTCFKPSSPWSPWRRGRIECGKMAISMNHPSPRPRRGVYSLFKRTVSSVVCPLISLAESSANQDQIQHPPQTKSSWCMEPMLHIALERILRVVANPWSCCYEAHAGMRLQSVQQRSL